jgi:hypothetical protein
MISKMNAEEALFRFVHTNAKLPFSLLGKLVDANNLYLFLGRSIRREASISENRLVSMLGNGQLSAFYEIYISLGGEKDPFLHRLLLFMDRKTPLEQWNYFEAMRNPDVYVWPEDAEPGIEVLEEMGALPLKREALKEIEKAYVLPRSLLFSLRAVSSYASALERMETWKRQGLLIPRESVQDSLLYENLDLEGYAQAARVRCLGHTPAILDRLDFLTDELAVFPRPYNDLEAEMVTRAAARLVTLKDRKISPADSLFIAKTAGVLQRRRGLVEDWQARYAVAGAAGGLFSWFARFVTGTRSDFVFRFCFIMIAVAGIALLLGKMGFIPMIRQSVERRAYQRGHPAILLVGIVFYLIFAASGDLLLSFPYIFSFSVGVLLGGAACYGLDTLALARNGRAVVDACASYCAQTADRESEEIYNLRRRWS